MMQIPKEIKEEFLKGNFVVKCSKQSFSQVDPDHAQEWLNRRGKIAGGIIGITRTISALMNWNLSYNARSFISDQTYEMFELKLDNLVTKETTNARKGRDNVDEDRLLEILKSFDVFMETSDYLVNIATKEVATDDIQESLLKSEENGEIYMIEFIKRITQETGSIVADEFYKTIGRNKTKTFETLHLKDPKSKDKEKSYVIKADRKTLVRIITAYNFGQKVDLTEILCNEMMPVPLALAELNGLLKSGDKAVLQKRLLHNIYCPDNIDLHGEPSCLIIDGQALVVSLGKASCGNFGELADHFIKSILWHGKICDRIDIVFDRYRDSSIKENTRNRRTKKQKPIRKLITNRDVPLPQNWLNFLACPENKGDYADFLSEQMKLKESFDKQMVTSGGFKDELEVWSLRDDIDTSQLSSTQEEADTRIILHAISSQQKCIVVSSRDTDVLVLLASHFDRINCTELWMKAGTNKKPKYIPVHDIVSSLPQDILKSLIPFHTLTGCDTTSFIAQHSKMTAWNTLISHPQLIENLGEDSFEESDYKKIEKFFCLLYGMPDEDSIDKVRLKLFLKKKNPDALPPTRDALYLHIKRAHYQSLIWKKAYCPRPILPDPINYGWEETNVGLKPTLMTKDGLPESVLKFTSCNCKTNCKTKSCGCKKVNLKCTLYCGCAKNDDVMCCMNAPDSSDEDDVD